MADLEAVHARHVDVEEHDVEGDLLGREQRLLRAVGGVCPESLHLHVGATVLASRTLSSTISTPERPGGRRGCRGRAPASKAEMEADATLSGSSD